MIGKFYCPRKIAVSVRIDNDVLAWLKSQGDGHLTYQRDSAARQACGSEALTYCANPPTAAGAQ